jgi:hypothetical protein
MPAYGLQNYAARILASCERICHRDDDFFVLGGHSLLVLDIFNAFFLILWCGKISYVRPFFDGMSAWRVVFPSTPSGKML